MENVNEVWKDIKGYPEYQISNCGRVWNTATQKCLKPYKHTNGYLQVTLKAINGKRKKELVHRLVALAFLDNPNNFPQVNHIDENKTNNHSQNLEWCSAKYNQNYGTIKERISAKNSKPVRCVETGVVYTSGIEAAKALNSSQDMVSKVLHEKDRCKTIHGYHLEFA